MLVSLGRYRLREWYETGSVNREIASYTIHPDYTHQGTGDSDLAILILRTPVEFSPTIKPICLWSGSITLQSVVNKSGYVVGWGRDELGNPHLAEPRMARVPIVSQVRREIFKRMTFISLIRMYIIHKSRNTILIFIIY